MSKINLDGVIPDDNDPSDSYRFLIEFDFDGNPQFAGVTIKDWYEGGESWEVFMKKTDLEGAFSLAGIAGNKTQLVVTAYESISISNPYGRNRFGEREKIEYEGNKMVFGIIFDFSKDDNCVVCNIDELQNCFVRRSDMKAALKVLQLDKKKSH